jgi:ParB family chromosome partitioning protein
VRDQVLAHIPVAGHDVDHARRHARLVERLGEDEVAERRLGRRLDHHRAAGGQGGCGLPGGQRDRGVPRHDRRHHAHRHLGDDGGPVAGDDGALEVVGAEQVGVEGERAGHQAGLGLGCLADRAAHLVGGDAGDVGLPLGQQVGGPGEHVGPFGGGEAGPRALVEGAAGGGDGPVDVGGLGDGHLADRFLGRGRDHGLAPGAGGGDPVAVDVEVASVHQPVVHGRRR